MTRALNTHHTHTYTALQPLIHGLGHNFVWLIVLDTRSCGTSLHTYVTTHCIPTQVCRNVLKSVGKKNWHCVAFFFWHRTKNSLCCYISNLRCPVGFFNPVDDYTFSPWNLKEMTSLTSWPHMEKVLGTTRKRFTWYAFESSLMHLHAVRTCTAVVLAATWFITCQSSITGKTWCGKTIWSRSLASSRLSVVTAPFNTSQECRDISNLFGMRLMLLCFILPHS